MVSGSAYAQAKPRPGIFQGFSGNSDQPIAITSDELEADQTAQKVLFKGHVVATQGESTLNSNVLTVFYEDSGGDAAQPAQTEGTRSVKRLEAAGSVVVTSADQKAEGDTGTFDIQGRKATMSGNVMLTQGRNIVRGKRLAANLATNVVRLTGGVRAHFVQDQPPGRPQAKQKRKRPARVS